MRIALIVNNPARDLAGLTLLARELALRGARVFLVPMALQRRELGALRPNFVLFNQLRPLNEKLVRDLKNAGCCIGVLDDEGGVFSSFDWYERQMATNEKLRLSIDLFCAWGPKLAEYSACTGWYAEKSIHATGHPRFDFYAPQWRDLQLPDAPNSSLFSHPLILINSRFSRANPAFGTPEDELQTLVKSRGFSLEAAREFQAQMHQALIALAEMTNHLARKFPDVNWVFRPHPFENLETYRRLLEPRANLTLSRDGEIGGWLRLADAVIHRSCTTAIEAGMLGIPALSPVWVPMPDVIESTESVSISIKNIEAMENAIIALQQKTLERSARIVAAHQSVVREYFGFDDGTNYRRVADAILATLQETPKVETKKLDAIFAGAKPSAGVLRQWRDKLKNRKRDLEREANWKTSAKYFDANQVRAICEVLARKPIADSPGQSEINVSKIKVSAAKETGDYQRKFSGRAVAISGNV